MIIEYKDFSANNFLSFNLLSKLVLVKYLISTSHAKAQSSQAADLGVCSPISAFMHQVSCEVRHAFRGKDVPFRQQGCSKGCIFLGTGCRGNRGPALHGASR
ncbi:MAG: hypothetical protein ACRC56_00220 [Bosea sp. (in: a-proteobacteria)]